jgi:hypothetical protein
MTDRRSFLSAVAGASMLPAFRPGDLPWVFEPRPSDKSIETVRKGLA